jgi:hypothetical protein
MHKPFPLLFVSAAVLLGVATLPAQVPQGHYVFGTFGTAMPKGVYIAHPRTPGQPTAVTGLAGDLIATGSSCILYRPNDGAVLVGERSQVNSSVDVHVIELMGTAVLRDASFSVGTGGPCCGEIPQMGLLPDGRIVVAATDLSAGPLANYKTTSYGIQGVGIVDTTTGLVTPIPISNGATIVDVFNGLAVAPDFQSVFLGTYVSATQGDIWQVPIPGGGTAKLVASVPAGLSNLTFDNDGQLWVGTLDANQGLFRVDLSTGKAIAVKQNIGALNGLANESVTGNLVVVTATGGTPARSLFWMERDGTDHLLAIPGLATPSGVAVHGNPSRFGSRTATSQVYDWQLAPNPGGLPEPGNANFSLTVTSTGGSVPPLVSVFAICLGRMQTPFPLQGADIWVDLNQIIAQGYLAPAFSQELKLPIPKDPALTGIELFVQTVHQDLGFALGATPGLRLTVL